MGDVIEIDTWVDAAGKNGMRRDWIIRNFNSQKIITRATSTWVIMNRETRRLSKIHEKVKREVEPFHLNRVAMSTEDIDSEKIEKLNNDTADRIRSGLAPRWSDMDANQHVNNVKYIGWILEIWRYFQNSHSWLPLCYANKSRGSSFCASVSYSLVEANVPEKKREVDWT